MSQGMKTPPDVIEQIKSMRAKGVTQQHVAEILGVSRRTVIRIERNERKSTAK